ncbi:uncharacterized protein LOC123922006 [Trifolium pratense]|uniref:uncharacterized protein LOC123922006 n=1 Tax=Trifolium pratense TaxID=57577 RepID=UPI001E69364F|nr:uncharacterized protein LOC123922006 [Trifolium pratense]
MSTSTGSVYGTQPLGKFLKILDVLLVLVVSTSILVVIIPPRTTDVRVLSFGDSVWRNIESFPVVPLHVDPIVFGHNAVFFNGTLNWLAIHNYTMESWFTRQKYITVEQLIIVSLDLETETYNMYTLPQGFVHVPPTEPTVGVLGDSLCFSSCYVYNEAVFIIWQMKKFGDQESWTQFLKISFHDLQLNYDFSNKMRKYHIYISPLFLSKDGDTLVLRSHTEEQAILYNWRDHRVEQSRVSVHKTVIDDETYDQLNWDDANVCWWKKLSKITSDASFMEEENNKKLKILHKIEGERKFQKQDQLFCV